MQLVPFRSEHLLSVEAADAAEGSIGFEQLRAPEMLKYLERTNSWTILDEEGNLVVCMGSLQQWSERFVCWTFFTPRAAKHMVACTRYADKLMKGLGAGRLETTVLKEFSKGHRWAKLLGFEIETPLMKKYGPHGEDHVGYVRFQE